MGYSPWGHKTSDTTERQSTCTHTYRGEKNTFGELVPQLRTNAYSHTTNTTLNFLPLHEAFGKHSSLFSVPIILHFPEYH